MASKSTNILERIRKLAKKRAQRKENKKKKKLYRAFLNKMRRKAGRYGNGDGMDYDHDERRLPKEETSKKKKEKKE